MFSSDLEVCVKAVADDTGRLKDCLVSVAMLLQYSGLLPIVRVFH